jgi:putative FmdB family regulatory protein
VTIGASDMPIYVYHCEKCYAEKEMLKRVGDTDPEICDKCAIPMEKQLTAPGSFNLKGNGWYKGGIS